MDSGSTAPPQDRVRTDVELLSLLKDGSHEAFRELYDRHARTTSLVALRHLGSTETAEDAVQATFIVLWEKSKKIELVDRSLMPWLATVCRMQCQNIRKREAKHLHTQLEDVSHRYPSSDNIEQKFLDAELLNSLEPELEAMSAVDQDLFRLCLVNGTSYQAAAAQLNLTEPAVRNRLFRLRLKLRKSLSES